MQTITTPIIPTKQTFAKVNAPRELDLEAICVFAAIGFFLDTDTYWRDSKVLAAASNHTMDDKGLLQQSTTYFNWHYTPRNVSFGQALEEFSELFESIIKEQVGHKKVILPLSGGLDSRTQAVALKRIGAEVHSYSYEFKGGYKETSIAKEIAQTCDFTFKAYTIEKGYLWSVIDQLAALNQCYSDFTSPRQMAIQHQFQDMGDVFSLGHWGDVLFDDMKVADDLAFEDQVTVLLKKLLKKGGLQLAQQLWQAWELDGEFEIYFEARISSLLQKVNIPQNANAQIRAFKSLYWAPRWTSVNLSVFESVHPVTLPYYDQRMCEFICMVPEAFLKNRQLQIAYIKTKASELAKIMWQDQRPFNLNNYHYNKAPYNLPSKLVNKLKRIGNVVIGNPYVQRNWELQFLGSDNQKHLEQALLHNGLQKLIPEPLLKTYLNGFKTQDVMAYAHAINMLLVLSKFNELQRHA